MKKILLALVLLGTMSFGMSLSQLNSASKEDLMQINGIGAKKAAAILKARKAGKFTSFDDLASRVDGIGPQTALNIKNDVKAGDKVKKATKKAKKVSEKKPSKESLKKKTKESAKKKATSVKKSTQKKATKKLTKTVTK